jgi:hypothetical protein
VTNYATDFSKLIFRSNPYSILSMNRMESNERSLNILKEKQLFTFLFSKFCFLSFYFPHFRKSIIFFYLKKCEKMSKKHLLFFFFQKQKKYFENKKINNVTKKNNSIFFSNSKYYHFLKISCTARKFIVLQ